MRNFKSNTEDRFRGRFRENQNSRRFNNMYDVTCNKCRNKCQVPFKPTGSKPIYCDSCFKKNNQLNQDRASTSDSSSEQFNQVNAKLDRILKVLENLEVEDESEEDFEEESDDEDSNDK